MNRLWVLWNDDQPIGATMITTDIGITRYLSRSYFEHHYPDHVLRNALHYILFVVVHPAHVAKGRCCAWPRESFGLEAAEGALVIFDTPMMNQPGERAAWPSWSARLAKMVSPGSETHPDRGAALLRGRLRQGCAPRRARAAAAGRSRRHLIETSRATSPIRYRGGAMSPSSGNRA